MAERYEDQYRDRDRGYRPHDRGFMDRAGDEVRSWFGDDEAERRRQMDDRDRPRERQYGQSSDYYNRAAERGQGDRTYGSGDRGYYDRGNSGYGSSSYGSGGYGSSNYGGGYGNSGYGSSSYGNSGFGDRGYGDRGYADRGYGYGSSAGMGGGWDARAGSSQSQSNRELGQFSGRGPKGYQRSDARISEDVCDRLCDAGDIDASQIEVQVDKGEVTLSGSVSDRADKRRAEDLIENVSGVREVHNNLRVNRGQDEQGGLGRTGVLGLNTDTGGANQAGSGSARTRTVGAGAGAGGVDIQNPGITGGGPSGASNTNPTR